MGGRGREQHGVAEFRKHPLKVGLLAAELNEAFACPDKGEPSKLI